MTPTSQWAAGLLITLLLAMVSGIAYLVKAAKDAGRRESKLDTAIAKLDKIETQLEKIANHETRIGQLEELFTQLRSDIKHLLRGSNSWEGE